MTSRTLTLSPERALILRAFEGQPEGLKADDVARHSRIPVARVRTLIAAAINSRHLERTGLQGWYRRTQHGAEALDVHDVLGMAANRHSRPAPPGPEPQAPIVDLDAALKRIAVLESALTPFVECALRIEPPLEDIRGDVFGDADALAPGEQKMSFISPPISALRAAVAAMPGVRLKTGAKT